MRYLALFCCLLAATTLDAQLLGGNETRTRNGWEISASFAPDFIKRVALTSVRFERDPRDVPLRFIADLDTLRIAGQERFFGPAPDNNLLANPKEADFWYGAIITGHRRIGRGVDISAGLFFNRAGYTTGIDDEIIQRGVVNTSAPIIFTLEEVEQRSIGITLRGNYHIFSERRLHPYFGMGINVYHSRRDQHSLGMVYLGESVEILPLSAPVPDFSASRMNFDFVATAGLLFRITDAWSVGLDITSRPFTGPGLVGVQVRRGL